MSQREITIRVEACPHCEQAHRYIIEVTARPLTHAPETRERAHVAVACAIDGRPFLTRVDLEIVAGQKFVAAQFAGFAG